MSTSARWLCEALVSLRSVPDSPIRAPSRLYEFFNADGRIASFGRVSKCRQIGDVSLRILLSPRDKHQSRHHEMAKPVLINPVTETGQGGQAELTIENQTGGPMAARL